MRAVVELKDTLAALDAKHREGGQGRAETLVEQAFSYPSKFGGACRWVLVNNFLELRLYIALGPADSHPEAARPRDFRVSLRG